MGCPVWMMFDEVEEALIALQPLCPEINDEPPAPEPTG